LPEATTAEEEARLGQQQARINEGEETSSQDANAVAYTCSDAHDWRAWMRHFVLKRLISPILLTPLERIELALLSSTTTPALSISRASSSSTDSTFSFFAKHNNASFELLQPKLLLINQNTNLFLLFTFGATSPLLSLVIVTAMITHSIHTTLVIGRFVHKEAEFERRGKIQEALGGIDELNEACRKVNYRFLQNMRWLLLLLSSSFFAFFVLDTFGDVVGYHHALAPFLLMLFSPLLIFLSERLLATFSSHATSSQVQTSTTETTASASEATAATATVTTDALGLELKDTTTARTTTTNPLCEQTVAAEAVEAAEAARMDQVEQGDVISARIEQ